MILLDLPEDLSVALLSEWLEHSLFDLSHLDVACCNHASRQRWLQVLRCVRIEEAKAPAKPLRNFVIWLHDRDVAVNKLRVWTWKDHSLSDLSLRIRTPSLHCDNSACSVRALLSFFPCLTALDLDCRYIGDGVFPDLSRWCPPLQQLSLRDCRRADMTRTVALLSVVSTTLVELLCEPMDERMVLVLVEHYSTLRTLTCFLDATVTAASITALCIKNSQLTHINFDGELVTDELVLGILTACPHIRELVLGVTSPSSLTPNELLHSPLVHRLDYISVRPCDVRFFPGVGKKRYCDDVVIRKYIHTLTLSTLLTNTSLAVRGITFSARDEVMIVTHTLRMLVDSHGPSLEKCELHLWRDVQPVDVQYFLSRCPNMTDLALNVCWAEQSHIDDEVMSQLPLWCPRMRKLQLIDCAVDITDEAISDALQKWAPNITVLTLNNCPLLTDAVLPIIERHCPQLTMLSVPRTSISKESLLQFVLSMSRNKVFAEVEPHCAYSGWIAAELKKHGGLLRKVKVRRQVA